MGQKTCFAPACAIEWAKQHPDKGLKANKAINAIQKRARSRQRREGLERLMTRSDYIKRAQKTVNLYVRIRDRGKPCYTCGAPDRAGIKRDAGHWLSCGAHPAKRFDVRQIKAQCVWCNQHRSGAPLEFKSALIREYGEEVVADIEKPIPPAKWTIEDLKAIDSDFKERIKALQTD